MKIVLGSCKQINCIEHISNKDNFFIKIIMNNKRKSKYDYSEGQKELNRAIKMQDIELKKLEECSQQLSSSITDNEKQIAKMG